MSKTKEIKCMEVSSCNNCCKWKHCMERGRGACGDYESYEERSKRMKKAKRKESLKMVVSCFLIVIAAYAIILY